MTSSDLPKLWTTLSKIAKSVSDFSVSKIGQIFPKKISVNNIWLEDQLILMKLFENFDFQCNYLLKMSPIFVDSVHNFGKSEDDNI